MQKAFFNQRQAKGSLLRYLMCILSHRLSYASINCLTVWMRVKWVIIIFRWQNIKAFSHIRYTLKLNWLNMHEISKQSGQFLFFLSFSWDWSSLIVNQLISIIESLEHFIRIIKWNYNRSDISLSAIRIAFQTTK